MSSLFFWFVRLYGTILKRKEAYAGAHSSCFDAFVGFPPAAFSIDVIFSRDLPIMIERSIVFCPSSFSRFGSAPAFKSAAMLFSNEAVHEHAVSVSVCVLCKACAHTFVIHLNEPLHWRPFLGLSTVGLCVYVSSYSDQLCDDLLVTFDPSH